MSILHGTRGCVVKANGSNMKPVGSCRCTRSAAFIEPGLPGARVRLADHPGAGVRIRVCRAAGAGWPAIEAMLDSKGPFLLQVIAQGVHFQPPTR